jgi:hypothetical protein
MPLTARNIFGGTDTGGTLGSTNAQRAVACSCPACTGLGCLDRPRFFAGQLLSEAELNSEMDYILAKQRLHNRYLHGVGTVCGLEVVCNNCNGQVTVKAGYAIDPCGNDIIVCQDQQFDVMKAIQACCDAVKKKNKTVCDPYQPFNPGCTGLEQKWCITIAYQETPTQPVTPLRGKTKTCSCAGSCSSVGSCGCNGGNGSTTTASNGCTSTATAPTTPTSTACEPTRVLESFTLGVVPDPGNCTDAQTLFQNTLLGNIFRCFSALLDIKTAFSPTTVKIIGLIIPPGSLPNSQVANSDAFAACCQLRQYAINLFTNADFNIKCTVLNAFDAIICPQPPQDSDTGSDPEYLSQVQDTMQATLLLLVEFVRDCICDTIMPSCPTDPGDDRLILACLTIKDGTITDICNFGCRQFAGSFPSFFYWLSLIPIGPLLKLLADDICCTPGLIGAFQRDRRAQLSSRAATIDPTGSLFNAITAGNFALPQMVMDRAMDAVQKFSLQGIISGIPANALNLATLRGMSAQNAQASLKQFNVSFEEKQVNSRADIPLFSETPTAVGDLVNPFAQSGDHVILYETGGNVVEVQNAGTTSANEVADLRRQVTSLQADIANLKAAQDRKK